MKKTNHLAKILFLLFMVSLRVPLAKTGVGYPGKITLSAPKIQPVIDQHTGQPAEHHAEDPARGAVKPGVA